MRRRALLGAAGVRRPSAAGRVYLLVHGAWHGGWCWRDVRTRLEAQGARVLTPTLTGLGERAHLMSPAIGLNTHVQDVCAAIEAEELERIVVCGHSYGGMVVTGVADRLKARLSSLVYLDAAVPSHGQSMVTQGPGGDDPAAAARLRALAPDGVAMAAFPPEVFGVAPGSPGATWLRRRLTPHPLKTWLDPLRLAHGGGEGLPRHYIHCTTPALPGTSFAANAERFDRDPAWRVTRLATGHDAMVTAPGAVTDLLLAAPA